MKDNKIIWDIFIRIFHWSLVILIPLEYFSDQIRDIHADIGYLVLLLICIRVVWGLISTSTASFSHFPLKTKLLVIYFKGVMTFKPVSYHGHNPAGAWITILFILVIFLTTLTGTITLASTHFEGFWVEIFLFIDDDLSLIIRNFHILLTKLLLFLIFIHLLGVITAMVQHKKNIIIPLFKGR